MEPILLPNLTYILAKELSRQNLRRAMNGANRAVTIHNFEPFKIVNPPYQDLCIEHIGTCEAFPIVSVAHYYEQEGDLMKDPDMTFQIFNDPAIHNNKLVWRPLTYELSSMGVYSEAVHVENGARKFYYPRLYKDLCSFARLWDRNFKAQRYTEK